MKPGNSEVWCCVKWNINCNSPPTPHHLSGAAQLQARSRKLLPTAVSSVAQSCLTLCDPSIHGISQARILEWVAISSSKGSFWSKDWTCVSFVSYIGRQILYHWATWEAWGQGQNHLKGLEGPAFSAHEQQEETVPLPMSQTGKPHDSYSIGWSTQYGREISSRLSTTLVLPNLFFSFLFI